MMLSEYDTYITAIDYMETRTTDDDKYPVVKDYKIKHCCKYTLEVTQLIFTYLSFNINASQKSKSKDE